MTQIIKFLFASVLLVNFCYPCCAQDDGPTEECAAGTRLKSVACYDAEIRQDGATGRRLLIGLDLYDRAGHHTLWRQYRPRDSTAYSDRVFEYNQDGKFAKMTDDAGHATDRLVDSLGTDANGLENYRKLYRPGNVLAESFRTIEYNQQKQPVKVRTFDREHHLLGYTLLTYDTSNREVAAVTFTADDSVSQQTTYSYYPSGKPKEIAEIAGKTDTTETKKFTSNGLLAEEKSYSRQFKGSLEYKVVRKYDSQRRETENITYTGYNKLRAGRREVSQYATSCLKTKTLIYNIDEFSGKQELTIIFVYKYEFYN